jgi:hypothetical protein
VLVTTNVDAGAVGATASGLESASGTTGAKMKPNINGADTNRAVLPVLLLIRNGSVLLVFIAVRRMKADPI